MALRRVKADAHQHLKAGFDQGIRAAGDKHGRRVVDRLVASLDRHGNAAEGFRDRLRRSRALGDRLRPRRSRLSILASRLPPNVCMG